MFHFLGVMTGALLFNNWQYNIKVLQGFAMILQILGLLLSILADDFVSSNLTFTIIFGYGAGLNMMVCL